MEIRSNFDFIKSYNVTERTLKQSRPTLPKELEVFEGEKINEVKDSKPLKSLLTLEEQAMLHMLFGAEKPRELEVYGKSKLQQIHKGRLVDLIG
ncbi:MAG: hypothetical protein QW279_15590 [Candidatus Jordarchaeaceae archaeon]